MSRESNSRRIHQAAIDALESRRLLADFASVNAGGTLSVVGTSNNDTITIDQSGSNIVARRGSQSLSFASSAVKRFWVNAFSGNDRVTINVARPSTIIGSSGNDTLTGGNNKDSIDGETGNDRLDGRGDADILNGGDGDDTYAHGAGDDTGDAGDGLLTLDYSNAASGEFRMTVYEDGAQLLRPLTGEIDAFRFRPQEGDLHVSLIGTAGDDQINALIHSQGNVPLSMAVDAAGGDDFLIVASNYAFTGPPTIALGGDGDDTIKFFGEDYFTTSINGGAGDDLIIGDGGTVALLTRQFLQIDGGSGRDKVMLEPNRRNAPNVSDVTVPNWVEDYEVSALNEDRLRVHGNTLDNVIQARAGQVTINGNGGNDQLIAIAVGSVDPEPFPAIAQLDGGSGNDTLVGGDSDDDFYGGAGDDTFITGGGNNTGDAGTGRLTIDLTGTTPGEISGSIRSTNNNAVGRFIVDAPDSQSSFLYDVTGGNTSVFLLATGGDDDISMLVVPAIVESVDIPITVSGGAGNDNVFAGRRFPIGETPIVALGGDGNDTLQTSREEFVATRTEGGDGDDQFFIPGGHGPKPGEIIGGNGFDFIEAGAFTVDRPIATFTIPSGVEKLRLTGDSRDSFIVTGNDLPNDIEVFGLGATIRGAGGSDKIVFHALPSSSHQLNTSYLEGGAGNDTLISDDSLIGGASADTMLGNSGDDFLEGNAGNDNLFGGSGNDTLVGGAGRDLLHGQDGDDRIFALDNEIDTLDGGAGFDRAQRDNAGSIVDSVSNVEQFI